MRSVGVLFAFVFCLLLSSVFGVTLTSTPASRWKSFFGVNSHIYTTQAGQSTTVRELAIYVGVGAIRDDIPYGGFDTTTYNDFVAMNNAGIKLNALGSQWEIQDPSRGNTISDQVAAWANFQQQTGMIESIEGYNEINMSPFVYNGIDPSQSYAGMIQAIQDMYNAVKSNSVLSNLPFYDATDVCVTSYPGCNSISGRADYANIHPYPYSGDQSISLDGSTNYNTQYMNFEYSGMTNPAQFIITETGYQTSSYNNGISELAHGKVTVNILLNALSMGFRKAFIYELWDEAQYSTSDQGHFGLFRSDTSPKPAAKALHFLSQLLSDASGQSTTLSFTLTNAPQYTNYYLFQNSQGVYFLVFWINKPVWNGNDIYNAPQTVTLNLPWVTTVNVYDIYSSASDQSPLPPLSTQTSSSISFSFADTAIVCSFSAGTVATPPPTSPPSSTDFQVFTDSVNSAWTMRNARSWVSLTSSPAAYRGSVSVAFGTQAPQTFGNLEFDYNYGVLSMAGKTHMRFAARSNVQSSASNLGIQASSTPWTSSTPVCYAHFYGPDALTYDWTEYTIPLTDFGTANQGVMWILFLDQTGGQMAYYIDQLEFITITNEVIVYDDSLGSGWNMRNARSTAAAVTGPVWSGLYSMSFTIDDELWGNLEFYRSSALSMAGKTHLRFAARAAQSTSNLIVQCSNVAWTSQTPNIFVEPNYGPNPVTWAWTLYTIPLADLGAGSTDGALFVLFLDHTGQSGITYFIDRVEFITLY